MEDSINNSNFSTERLTEMEEKIDAIDLKLTQVVDAIIGNPLTKAGGLINEFELMKKQISDLQKKQTEYDDFKKRSLWTVAIIVAVGAIIQYATQIYSNLNTGKPTQTVQTTKPIIP